MGISKHTGRASKKKERPRKHNRTYLNILAKNAGKLMRESWGKQLKSPKDPTIQSL